MADLSPRPAAPARRKLLEAALKLIRSKGYAATSIDDLCAEAQVSKGAFFHHFKDKEALAVAAAGHWSQTTGALFAAAPYHAHADPLDRVLGYIDFRKSILIGAVSDFTCLVGTMVQEAYESHPAIRDACAASIEGHAAKLEADIAAALTARGVGGFTPASLALHTQAVLQGAFILAKAKNDAQAAAASVDHLRRYFELLFREPRMKITVETLVAAPLAEVWRAYVSPEDIKQWNAASADWRTTAARVDLREGGEFSYRMEAKDGSFGFDFAGRYTAIEPERLIEYAFGDRTARIAFEPGPQGVRVRVSFEPETTHPQEQQRGGWQAILDNFKRHVEAR